MADDQHRVITDNQIVALQTKGGATLYEFRASDQETFNWSRESTNVSTFDLTAPPIGDPDRVPAIQPWLHWVTVWDGDRDALLWKGPVYKSVANKRGVQISARDTNVYLSRTRTPITKRWDAADPSWVAGELWRPMAERQGLDLNPIILTDPEGDRYDFHCVADEQMLDQTVKELVNLGLTYTCVSGAPILGPAPRNAIAMLGESDFIGDGISIIRDGSQVFNDVLVRVPGDEVRDRVPLAGANLETIVNLDNISDVSNVARAARQYLRQTSQVRADLDLPSGTVLHPSAPVSIDELIPSTRYWITAQGVQQEMRLESVTVDRAAGSATVKVTMTQVVDVPELTDTEGTNRTLGGQLLPGQTS
ncbi:minor tail protein [Mycobacterium phage Baee]|uniref:Minor tail protein n=1 Tax=Mycobacterium phage Baee TaxID=1647306 RepID=A0A0F6SJP9_9CAUD|nr:minor tail protein [Mycobacterium phage Baee]AKF14597.1 minor tail protein [Mycobacterium phage Baee]